MIIAKNGHAPSDTVEVIVRRASPSKPASVNDTMLMAEYVHRVRKPTSVPHFLYCITAMCCLDRTLFRCVAVVVQADFHPFEFRMSRIPISKSNCNF